jgi:hypothetical protein
MRALSIQREKKNIFSCLAIQAILKILLKVRVFHCWGGGVGWGRRGGSPRQRLLPGETRSLLPPHFIFSTKNRKSSFMKIAA